MSTTDIFSMPTECGGHRIRNLLLKQTDPKVAWHITSFPWKFIWFFTSWGRRNWVSCMQGIRHEKCVMLCTIWYHLYNFKKCEKHPWRSVTFSKVAGLLKVTLLHRCFSCFLNCTNGTKSRRASHLFKK